MKKLLTIIVFTSMVLLSAGVAHAALVVFDFNATTPTNLSTYMTQVLNNAGVSGTVTVTGTERSTSGTLSTSGTDGFLRSLQTTANGIVHAIDITFSVPISEVRFDWARESDNGFYADADGANFFSSTTASSGTYPSTSTYKNFTTPVYSFSFHDNWTGFSEIDNLRIQTATNGAATPEPTTMLLMGIGAAGLALRRKKIA